MNQVVLGVSIVALAVSVFAWMNASSDLPAEKTASTDFDRRLSILEQRFDELSDDVMQLMRDSEGSSRKASKKVTDPADKTLKPGAAIPANQANEEVPVADQLDSRLAALENKLRHRNPFGQWIATSEELKAELRLSKDQSAQAERLFNEIKDQTLELLSIANEEGVAPLDEMAEDFRQGMEFKPALDRLVVRMEATIPGTDDTYAERMQGVEQGLFDRLESTLSDSQFERLKKANIAPSMIQTGYDPVGEYIRKSLEADGKR